MGTRNPCFYVTRTSFLRYPHIEQRQPILQRLQSKSAQDESDAESAEALFRKVVGVVLDVRSYRDSDARDKPGHEAYLDGKKPGMVDSMRERATNKGRSNIAERPNDSPLKLTARDARSTRSSIVNRGTHAARVGDDLADGDDSGKCHGEFEPQNSVESGADSQPAKGAETCFPR